MYISLLEACHKSCCGIYQAWRKHARNRTPSYSFRHALVALLPHACCGAGRFKAARGSRQNNAPMHAAIWPPESPMGPRLWRDRVARSPARSLWLFFCHGWWMPSWEPHPAGICEQKHSSWEEHMWTYKLSEHQIRGWIAVSASGSCDQGSRKRNVFFSQTPVRSQHPDSGFIERERERQRHVYVCK